MEHIEPGEDNPGYRNEEFDLVNVKEPSGSPLDGGHVAVVTDRDVTPHTFYVSEADDKITKYPGHQSTISNNGKDLVLQKKEFDYANSNFYERSIMFIQSNVLKFAKTNEVCIWRIIGIAALLGYQAYFAYAMHYRFGDEGSYRLLGFTIFGLFLLGLNRLDSRIEPVTAKIREFLDNKKYDRNRRIIRWVLYVVNVVVTVTVLIVVVALDTPANLLSLAGLAAFIVILIITSHSPAMINWHPVFWGLAIQFYFAIIILKTRWGYELFRWLGNRMTDFLNYSTAGARFVFGDAVTIYPVNGPPINLVGIYTLHYFAFAIMPIITFFSTFIAILYYLGVMQACTRVVGRFLSFCLATTPAESLNAAANIFASMTESPLVIRPYIATMTRSELHAVMVGGFASIAGGVMGVYIGFGVPADHLLAASVMSAPAALAISKITYPEVEVPIPLSNERDHKEESDDGNVIEAACSGAIVSAKIITSIIVNVIAFLSLLKFLDATLTWFGDRVGLENLSFELICSYVLYPVALFMGTELADCRRMAELVGIKSFTNEFIAYQKLSLLINNRKTYNSYVAQYGEGFTHWEGDDLILDLQNSTKLLKGMLSHRSEIIATYALCGFSNFGSIGISLGTLAAMAPNRKPTIAKLALRAMIAGNVASFITACIAGLFFQEFN